MVGPNNWWEDGLKNRWMWDWWAVRWTLKRGGTEAKTPVAHPSVFLGIQPCHASVIFYQPGHRLVLKRINYNTITGVSLSC